MEDVLHVHLHVQMNYAPAVNVFHALADLAHEDGARFLSQHKVIVYNALEQLASLDSESIHTKGNGP